MDRNLDGIYFRVEREGKWENVCFSDMTEEQQREAIDGKSKEWLISMCIGLAKTIRSMGDVLDVTGRAEASDE